MKSPQSSLTPLLLAPSLQLPATNHWGAYTAMQTDTHTRMIMHVQMQKKEEKGIQTQED